MPDKRILLVLPGKSGSLVERLVLRPAGYLTMLVSDYQAATEIVETYSPDAIIIGDPITGGNSLELAQVISTQDPSLPIIMLPEKHVDGLPIQALRSGFSDYLRPPARVDEVLQTVERAVERRQRWAEWGCQQKSQNNSSLEKRLADFEVVQRIGQEITSQLELERVLSTAVNSAVELTQAEEGCLLLLDENSGELFMRASRNINDATARTFRLPVRDSLAGQVIHSGESLLVNESTPLKIKTAYLVHTLIYVPLIVQDRTIGVLGVYNRLIGHLFSEYHVTLVRDLADATAIAIENARLFTLSEAERARLETILTRVEDGVILIDLDGRVMLANHTISSAFNLGNETFEGKHYQNVFRHPDLLDLLSEEKKLTARRMEITLEDGRVFNAQLTPIPAIGLAITMQDISHLKELDRIKTDFVNTLSHDLRSPLTAILGYVELLDRVGPVNDLQQEFVQRIRSSVNSITTLINDLFDLGRIEAGFDVRKEIIDLRMLVEASVEDLRPQIEEKTQTLVLDLAPDLPEILGDPARLRRMIHNLVGNASQFTPNEGRIEVQARAEADQVVLQVADNGPGIPNADQPYIFDKFYRGSNVPMDTPGSGLGLAIVKSIVESHQGRIWVDSTPHQGTTFTVVVPIADRKL